MKKNILPVLVLIPVLAVLLFNCEPSALEEKKKLENPDIVIQGGRIAYYFNEPKLELGKTYIVTFDMEDCDESLYGNRMGGKLSYEETSSAPSTIPENGLVTPPKRTEKAVDNMEKYFIVAGWDYCMPNIILDRPMRYKWTFTVGDQQRDNKPLFTDRNENTITGWTETPDGMKQFFLLLAQTLAWKNFPFFSQHGIKFGPTGVKISEKVMPEGQLTMLSAVTVDDKNSTTGAGAIRTDFTKLTTAHENDKDSFLRFFMRGCNLNGTEIQERSAVAAIGNLDNIRTADPNAMIIVPAAGTKRPEGVAAEDFMDEIPMKGGSGLYFFWDLALDDIMLFKKTPNDKHFTVKVTNGRLDRIELYSYQK